MGEKKAFTCPNPSCNRTVDKPIKALNLQDNPPEPYYACPVCLTKIETPELNTPTAPSISTTPRREEAKEKEKPSEGRDKPESCPFYLGYLSERKQKEIPEGCLVCRDIVSCMLKNMRKSEG